MSARSSRRVRERQVERQARREHLLGPRSTAALGAGTALGATMLFAPAADAATFTVTTLADDGPGSLRQAVIDASLAAGPDQVTFQSGLSGKITLTSGEIVIEEAVAIQGPGADQITVDGDESSRIFFLYSFSGSGQDVSISGLTLANGSTVERGGALYNGTGGDDGANLTIADAVLTGNHAGDDGGAVYSDDGTLAIVRSTLTDNEAVGPGRGGAVYVEDTAGSGGNEVVISDSVISGNRTEDDGGGVYISKADGATLIERTTISGNTAGEDAGGVSHAAGEDTGPVTVTDSTFSDNSSVGAAGGIWLLRPGGPVTIANSTFSGNVAYYGGGIELYNGYDVPVTIASSTIVDNSAESTTRGGGGIRRSAADDPNDDGDDTVTLSSTIVANNAAPVGSDISDTGGDGAGSFALGFSLVEDTSGAIVSENPAGSNITGQDPQLGPLSANGGPTQTHLPALTSPALDAGIANGLSTEQRGLARTAEISSIANRPGSDATDIGSVEIQIGDCQGQSVAKTDGSAGDDTLTGTAGSDLISGLAGNDSADALAGNDCVSGDEGNDKLKGGPGKDLISGGAGKDRASGQGGKDNLKGEAGKDALNGGGAKDKLNGAGGKDRLSGAGGKDKLKGGPGKDKITTGGGRDKVNCGGGNDTVNADAKDKVAANCETVT